VPPPLVLQPTQPGIHPTAAALLLLLLLPPQPATHPTAAAHHVDSRWMVCSASFPSFVTQWLTKVWLLLPMLLLLLQQQPQPATYPAAAAAYRSSGPTAATAGNPPHSSRCCWSVHRVTL
jgi:hypothetical protein